MNKDEASKEYKNGVGLTLKIVGIVFSTVVGLSVALQFTSIGYVSGLLVKLVDWYRWIAWSPWVWINIPILELDRDLFAVLGVILGIGARNRIWEKYSSTIYANEEFYDSQGNRFIRSLIKWTIIGLSLILYSRIVINIFYAIGIELFVLGIFLIPPILLLYMFVAAMSEGYDDLQALVFAPVFLIIAPVFIIVRSVAIIVRRNAYEVIGVFAAVGLIIGGAIVSESLFGDSLRPYSDAFPTAPKVGELPDFKLPNPSPPSE